MPSLNFQADHYYKLISLEENISILPISLQYTRNDCLESGLSFIKSIPCHSQAVERIVKTVTSASASIYVYERREGYIKCTLDSQKKMGVIFDKK